MIFEFGLYRVDVDMERTRRWYETEPTASQCCDCDGCVNFDRAADLFPESVKSFFASLGAAAKKPIEVYVNYTNKDGILWYGGWYHLCGTLLSEGEELWQVTEGKPFGSRGFQIFFRGRADCVQENCPRPVVQMELNADIPWVLEKENTYEKESG